LDLDREFDRRIAAIHGLDGHAIDAELSGKEDAMDVRHAELTAMTNVFLGANYDPMKRNRVENLQVDLHRKQAELAHRLQLGQVSREEFVTVANALIKDTFEKCEDVLGPDDFCKLFGAPPSELVGLIDRRAFLDATQESG
jgi:hypothetical protein